MAKKTVLLLGGSRYLLPVIDAAHALGYRAVSCDYLPDNIAHKYSDEYRNVSIIDKDAVLKLAQELKIDGIMSFACDPGVVTAAYVAEKLGLPSVGSYEAVSVLQNKARFRRFLAENGFNTPLARGYSDVDAAAADAERFRFPVIVKPVDSAGSKGCVRVDDAGMLRQAAEYALSFSLSGTLIVEEFIQQQGFSSDTDCFSVDGELVFASFNNQQFDRTASNPYTPSAFSWPSKLPEGVQRELRGELQRLISLLGLKTSIYNVETRLGTDGKAYLMEVSPRGGGNRLAEMLRYACGTDLLTNSVRAAVGEAVQGISDDPVYDGHWAEIVLHADADGRFDSLWTDPRLDGCIVEKDLWVKPGDEVHRFTGANQTIGTLVLKFDDAAERDKVIDSFRDYVRVLVS